MIDDATAAYIVENQRCFEDSEAGGIAVGGIVGAGRRGIEGGCAGSSGFAASAGGFSRGTDELRRARPTERARRHHDASAQAANSIGAALKEADSQLNVDRILIPLRAGYAELERAAGYAARL